MIEYLMLFTFAYTKKRYDSKKRFSSEMFNCHYNQNKGYVVFSAMGSFFIPMTVMLYVYSKIFYVLMSRQHRMSKTEVIFFTHFHFYISHLKPRIIVYMSKFRK